MIFVTTKLYWISRDCICLLAVKLLRSHFRVTMFRKSYLAALAALCFGSACAHSEQISYPDWAIAVANEKCKLWREKGYDYYEVRKYMKVEWSEEFQKEFSRLPYQDALDLSREVTGTKCAQLQDEAWEKFRDRQDDSGGGDGLNQ